MICCLYGGIYLARRITTQLAWCRFTRRFSLAFALSTGVSHSWPSPPFMAIGPALACVGSSIAHIVHYNVPIPSVLFCAGDRFSHFMCVDLLSCTGSEYSFIGLVSVSSAQTLAIPNLINDNDIFGVQGLTILGGIGQGATTIAWVEGDDQGAHLLYVP
jgi:hypothetical protein